MRRHAFGWSILLVAFSAGTWLAGWWTVPCIALLWGTYEPTWRGAFRAGLSAAVAWALLLAVPAALGTPTWAFGQKLAAVMGVPAAGLYAAVVVFPLLAGWAGAAVGSVLPPRGGAQAAGASRA